MRNVVVYGGVSKAPQINALENGVDILVATPGRLLDLMQQGYIELRNVEILILDEADQMLDMGFLPDLRRIVKAVPTQRQTLMFSATMPDEIRGLADKWLKNPQHISVSRVSSTAKKVKQQVYFVAANQKIALLHHLLDTTIQQKTLVFSRTKHGAEKIARKLKNKDIFAAAIHSNKTQNARQKTLASFKSKNPPVLIATDIAARGLDINGISHVINFDLPEVAENYVHRIGRTGRAGARGVAISFCADAEKRRLTRIERLTKHSIDVIKTPDLSEYGPVGPNEAPVREKKKDWAALKANKAKKRFYGSRGAVDAKGNAVPSKTGTKKKKSVRKPKSNKNDGGTDFAKKKRRRKPRPDSRKLT